MEKNLIERYESFDSKLNILLNKRFGNCCRTNPDVVASNPSSMVQSLIMLEVLEEIKLLREDIKSLKEHKIECAKEEVSTKDKPKSNSKK